MKKVSRREQRIIVFLPVCMSEVVSLRVGLWSVHCNCDISGYFRLFHVIVDICGISQLKAIYTLEMSNFYQTQIIK